MRVFWIVCLIILIIVLFVLGAYLLIGAITYRLALSRKGRIRRKFEKGYSNYLRSFNIDEKYFEEGFETIEIESKDNLKLYGFYKNNGQEKIVLLAHGYCADHKEMANYAKLFEKRGYDIFAIDHRAHGKSEGEDLTMGEKESEDLILWINKILQINPRYKIVLFGHSMGASTVCIALGKNLPANVVLAIEDCGYDNANNQFKSVYYKTKMPIKLFYKIFVNYTKKTHNFDIQKANALEGLEKSKIPVLFIHGAADNFVPTEMVYKLYDAVPEGRKSLYIAENAGHIESYIKNPDKYEKEINKFLLKYFM